MTQSRDNVTVHCDRVTGEMTWVQQWVAHCNRCGWEWKPKDPEKYGDPKQCAKCKSWGWNRELRGGDAGNLETAVDGQNQRGGAKNRDTPAGEVTLARNGQGNQVSPKPDRASATKDQSRKTTGGTAMSNSERQRQLRERRFS